MLTAHGPVERRIPEVEDAAVGGHQPVATPVRGLRNADDRRVEMPTAHRPDERRRSVGEDAAVAGREHQALALCRRKRHLLDEHAQPWVIPLSLRWQRSRPPGTSPPAHR